MKKIGGDFEYGEGFRASANQFDCLANGNHALFSSGRNAIYSLLKKLNPKKALLPSYICQSIIDAFEKSNVEIEFYKINRDLSIDVSDLESKIKPKNLIFFINYFGRIQEDYILESIRKIAELNSSIIIEDSTHSIFSETRTIGDYAVASLRKWLGIADGAIIYSSDKLDLKQEQFNDEEFLNLKTTAMKLKSKFKDSSNEKYLQYYEKAEAMLDSKISESKISDFSYKILSEYDFEKMKQTRKQNFLILQNKIDNPRIEKIIQFKEGETYLSYPVYVTERDNFRKFLFEKKIFCPVHWPVVDKRLHNFNRFNIQDSIISIIIDQRYTKEDMEYISNMINSYI